MSQPHASKQWRPFPELKNAEILQIMDELRIPLTEADLLKPNPAHIQRVYELFIELFVGTAVSASLASASGQPHFAMIDILEYPDIHMDAIHLMSFYRTILKLMEGIGMDDFTLKDIIKPEPHRLKIIFSGVINFAKFREEQLVLFEEFSAKTEESSTLKKKLDAQQHALEEKLCAIRLQREREAPTVKSLESDVAALVEEIRGLKREQGQISAEVNQLKLQKDQLGDTLAANQFQLMNLRQESEKWQSRIVHNPELLIQCLADMTAEIQTEKALVASCEKQYRECSHQSDMLRSIECDIARSIAQMRECAEALKLKIEAEARLASEKENYNRRDAQNKEALQRDMALKRQASVQQEKLDKLNQQQSAKRGVIEESLTSLRQEYDLISKERQAIQEKIDRNDKLVKEMETKMADVRRHHDHEVASLQQAYASLGAQVQMYHHDLKKHLDR